MGKKYIIELEDKPVCVFDEDTHIFFPRLHRVKGFNSLVFDQNGLDKLIPYTEPEPHAEVTADAYQRGYEAGLNDAWEAARKICTNWVLSDSVLSEIFGMDKTIDDIMKENTASEVIEKIRQYEQENEEIQVGDEVYAPFGKAIVVNIDSVAKKIWLVYADGHGGFEYFKDAPNKTGRHFPEIAEVLQKMKEANNG